MTDAITYSLVDSVALITMDDGKANALSPDRLELLSDLFKRAKDEAKSIVLAGRPGRFSGGFDLKIMMSGPKNARALVKQGAEVLMDIYEHPQPIVAAVSGHAIAGGVLLAACCDHRIGIEGDFKLGLNEVTNGLPLPILAHELARDRLSKAEFTRATLFATMYNPEEAKTAGWLDEVVPASELPQRAFGVASALAQLPGSAFATSKRSIRRQTIDFVRETLVANLAAFEVQSG